jgi:hypothetical protein
MFDGRFVCELEDIVEIKIRNKSNYNGEGIYVGRGSPLGNSFRITDDQSRERVIKLYGKMLIRAIQDNQSHIITALTNIETFLHEHGKCNLICHCSPKPCHADLIKQVLINKFKTGEWLTKQSQIGVYGL